MKAHPHPVSRLRYDWTLALSVLCLLLGAGICQAGNGIPWWYFLGNLKIGPFPSQRLCRDDLGSCHSEHGPKCLPSPTGTNCAPIGPGFGVINGVDLCSNDCVAEGYLKGYYFVVVNADGSLSLAGPYSKRACERLSDECLSIGALPNTEGSRGGP